MVLYVADGNIFVPFILHSVNLLCFKYQNIKLIALFN